MKRLFSSLWVAVSLAGSLAVAVPALAAPEKQIIDIANSTMDFTAYSTLIDALGTFRDWKGEVILDREDITKSSVKVSIDAKSIDTRLEKRNNHLRSADFLDVAKFPTITFSSTRITRTGEKTFDMLGDLTIHGVTRPVTLNVTIDRLADPFSRFRATGSISRGAFGVSYNPGWNPIQDELKLNMVINVHRPDVK